MMAPLPASVATPKFQAQLTEARRLRDELPELHWPLGSRETLDGDDWREAAAELRATLSAALLLDERPLERLHGKIRGSNEFVV